MTLTQTTNNENDCKMTAEAQYSSTYMYLNHKRQTCHMSMCHAMCRGGSESAYKTFGKTCIPSLDKVASVVPGTRFTNFKE
jgi:hypothetical protein